MGCIQSLLCNTNHCPTGVATQDKELMAGLVVADKKFRVANYHHETVKSLVELLAAAGLKSPDEIRRNHVYRRISMNEVRSYAELFPYLEPGCLIQENTVPANLLPYWKQASSESF